MKRSPFVSRARTVGKTEAKTTKRVKAITASLCIARRIWGKRRHPGKDRLEQHGAAVFEVRRHTHLDDLNPPPSPA